MLTRFAAELRRVRPVCTQVVFAPYFFHTFAVDRELSIALADLKQKKAECVAAEARAKSLQEKKSSMVEHLRMVIHDGETRRAGDCCRAALRWPLHVLMSARTFDEMRLQVSWRR
jgi:hypothetical protein